MVDDSVHHREIHEEGNDLHLSLAFGTEEWVDLINLVDHCGPAAAGDSRAFLLAIAGAFHQETDQIAESRLSVQIRLEEAAQERASSHQRVNRSCTEVLRGSSSFGVVLRK